MNRRKATKPKFHLIGTMTCKPCRDKWVAHLSRQGKRYRTKKNAEGHYEVYVG